MPTLGELPDSAYGDSDLPFGEFGADGYDYRDMTRAEFDHRMRQHQRYREEREYDPMERDEESGYNWGPPPSDDDGPDEPDDVADPDPDDWHHDQLDSHPLQAPHYDDFDPLSGENADGLDAEEHRVGAIRRQAEQWPHL